MTITAHSLKNYQVEIRAGNHIFLSDEPTGIGDDKGPGPFDLLLSSLASCTIITLQMYARRKDWPLELVEAEVFILEDQSIPNCLNETCHQIAINLKLHGPLSAEQIVRLEEIASRCPVHRFLKGDIQILTKAQGISAP
jgi:putative redox protein